jgi:hypothetical protein
LHYFLEGRMQRRERIRCLKTGEYS